MQNYDREDAMRDQQATEEMIRMRDPDKAIRRRPADPNHERAARDARAAATDAAVFSAYLGICVLQTMCNRAGLQMAETRAKDLLIEMDTAFPGLAGRAALRSMEP